MALKDIKKSIEEEALAQIKEIEAEGQKKVDAVNELWSRKIEERKNEVLASAQKKAEQKLQQTDFKLQAQSQTAILNQKQKILDQVYKQALTKLNQLDEGSYVNLLSKLISELPDIEGELISAEGKDAELKKALKKSGRKITVSKDTVKASGGFVFKSDKMEIDQTFPALTRNAKEISIIEVANKLFNQE